MGGAVTMLQGLCIFPRVVTHSANTLERVTEAWLVGEGADQGPAAVHSAGLWIGMGLRGAVHAFQVGFGWRNGSVPTTWVTPSGTDKVKQALEKAFGASTAKWKGYHLALADLPGSGPSSWNALYFRIVTEFKPNKKRDFHLVPVVVALAGGTEDTLGEAHYLLGATVFTRAGADVEDFMVVTQAFKHDPAKAEHPGIDIPEHRSALKGQDGAQAGGM